MITEQQQREAYEWRYDVEVTLSSMGFFWGKYENEKGATLWLQLPPLYTPDGKPDMNTWYYEFVPRLEAEDIHVIYAWTIPDGIYRWTFLYQDVFPQADPYAAFSQWMEASQC